MLASILTGAMVAMAALRLFFAFIGSGSLSRGFVRAIFALAAIFGASLGAVVAAIVGAAR